jgi:hypothetical protein
MDSRLANATLPEPSGPPRERAEVLRCAICERRVGDTLAYMEETGDVPEPRQSWLLCQVCSEAVRAQIERSPVASPLRLRVAIGLVASERTPEARREHFGQLSDRNWERVFFWSFVLAMMAHLAVMIFIAGLIASH